MVKIRFYKINLNYIKFLHTNYDSRVQYNSSQNEDYNKNRPYIGIVLEINNFKYFAPLEHPRPEHVNFKNNTHIVKIQGGKYGIIGLNNMIPVHESQLIDFDISKDKNKAIFMNQFIFCRKNKTLIMNKALKVYEKRTIQPDNFVKKIYCDFKKLEEGLKEYCKLNNIGIQKVNSQENEKTENQKEEINLTKEKQNKESVKEKIEKAKMLAESQASVTTEEIVNKKSIEKTIE